jgi:hypothetical protein
MSKLSSAVEEKRNVISTLVTPAEHRRLAASPLIDLRRVAKASESPLVPSLRCAVSTGGPDWRVRMPCPTATVDGDLARCSQAKRGLHAPEYIVPLGTLGHAGRGGNELAEGVEEPGMARAVL